MSKICCFAGHSQIYDTDTIYQKLLLTIEDLTQNQGVNEFWVGNYGAFDRLSAAAVRTMKEKYPLLRLNLVVPYLTNDINTNKEYYYTNYDNILMADIPEKTPQKLDIIKTNRYMIKNCDFLVCFTKHSFGGAAKTVEFAKKTARVKIINLCE